jgi:carbon storage regulator CsrA
MGGERNPEGFKLSATGSAWHAICSFYQQQTTQMAFGERQSPMLLSRRLNQGLVIDGKTRLRILEVRGDRVRLAIEAPEGVRLDREEAFPPQRGRVDQAEQPS